MALSGLDIYKLLPKTNCRDCGFPTCLAFGMQLAKKAVELAKCPHLSQEVIKALEESSLPPIRLVEVGAGEDKLAVGSETVLFRHEEKFFNPCGIGFILEDSLQDEEIKEKLSRIQQLRFERVGQEIKVNLIAIKQTKDKKRFAQVTKDVAAQSKLPLCLMSDDIEALKESLGLLKDKKPLLYGAKSENFKDLAGLAKEFNASLVVSESDLEKLAGLTKELNSLGVNDLILDTTQKGVTEKIWDLTQIRRLALKKSLRSLGYPTLVTVGENDPYAEAIAAATYISKYAGIVLLRGIEAWQTLALLTLRQNIYTDPQKPLQIEPKLYPVGQVSNKSPVLITTNFSLTYYTVLGEVEASKVPSYIVSVDTEGMSVLTAWAAEKLTAEKITDSLKKFAVPDTVSHKRMVIPGYVAVISGDLEDRSGWQVVVGPKEASGIPQFLKNLS
jgi:acetyl-CoA decarbonylase/synthase complex subunit gamma